MIADTVFPQIRWYRFSLDVRRAEDILEWLQNGTFTNTIPWISDVIKHLQNISSLVLFIWMPEVWNKHRTALSAVGDQHFILLLPKYCALCWILFPLPPSSWRRGLSRLQCVVQSTQLQSKISSWCFISLSFFLFFCFQKSLRTLSQLHQKVSSDSYFLFKRRETICVSINFLSRLFYVVRTNQNSLLENHCFLPAWTKYSLSSVTIFKPTTVQRIAVTKTIKLPPAVVIYTSNTLFKTPVTHMAYT